MDTFYQRKARGKKVARKAAKKKSAKKKQPVELTPRQLARERKKREELLARFERLCDGLAQGKTHATVMEEVGITWREVLLAWHLGDEVKQRYKNAKELGAEVRRALVEDEMFRRGMDGNLEQAATPEGDVVTLRKPADRVLIRVYDQDHTAKQDVKISGDISMQMLRDAMRAGEEGNAR